jgi:ABC-type multidrug transport system fused ATPase/permease subunit
MNARFDPAYEAESATDLPAFDRFMRKVFGGTDIPPTPVLLDPVAARDVLRWYWKSLKKRPKTLWVIGLGLVIHSATLLLFPMFIRAIIDRMGDTPGEEAFAAASALVGWFLVAEIVRWAGSRAMHFGLADAEAMTMVDLKEVAHRHLIHHGYRFFSGSFTGGLTTKLNRFAYGLERLLDRLVFDVATAAIHVVGASFILATVHLVFPLAIGIWV